MPRIRQPIVEARRATAWVALALLFSACSGVKYPLCGKDQDCADHRQVCVAGHCQQCRDDNGCEAHHPGEGRVCHEGRCEPAACREDGDCRARGALLVCREGTCATGCASAADCGTGMHCAAGHCRPGCAGAQDCATGEHCVAGLCQAAGEGAAGGRRGGPLSEACQPDGATPGQVVRLDAVRFAFNTFDLDEGAQQHLQGLLACLNQAPAGLKVVVEGHCDDRGTQEYNLALGQRRAQSVVDYLVRLGADGERLGVRSKGENEPLCTTAEEACFAQNRRVEFIQSLGGQP